MMNTGCTTREACQTDELTCRNTRHPLLRHLRDTLKVWRNRDRERRQLKRLDARMLRDMGISPHRAEQEWRKPFWRR